MTEEEYRKTALEYGYTEKEIEENIRVFRTEEQELTGSPFPWEELPLEYKRY